jgi:hypothetical protein
MPLGRQAYDQYFRIKTANHYDKRTLMISQRFAERFVMKEILELPLENLDIIILF